MQSHFFLYCSANTNLDTQIPEEDKNSLWIKTTNHILLFLVMFLPDILIQNQFNIFNHTFFQGKSILGWGRKFWPKDTFKAKLGWLSEPICMTLDEVFTYSLGKSRVNSLFYDSTICLREIVQKHPQKTHTWKCKKSQKIYKW